jgi:hypothetical protein
MGLPELLAAFGFFGAIFVCPLIWMLLKHQREMAAVIHGRGANEALQRVEMLEREVQALKAAHHERVLRDDDQQGLGQRLT